MKFIKDILLIDFEGRNDPVQIGAILLDKNTLKEKDAFSSYIWADLTDSVALKSGITQDMLEGAPSQAEVGKMIFEKFGTDIFIGSWVANKDMKHFEKIMLAAEINVWEHYDYHIFDIWPAAYIYSLQQEYKGSIKSEEMFQFFGAKPRGLHDALEDCRITADVLRKITSGVVKLS